MIYFALTVKIIYPFEYGRYEKKKGSLKIYSAKWQLQEIHIKMMEIDSQILEANTYKQGPSQFG